MNDQDALEEELGEVRKAEPANPAMQRKALGRPAVRRGVDGSVNETNHAMQRKQP